VSKFGVRVFGGGKFLGWKLLEIEDIETVVLDFDENYHKTGLVYMLTFGPRMLTKFIELLRVC
jgi:hypothetical protein